ncbi:MAG: UDP-N-acetylglucosamine--N-acetylmuramyl-(pentapeptide) pyrophosphoryl-undecaprenol N-acetylglucosamine transferase [bacterium]|nr:UDP-N-acetylglucosamine--N-acetylmuramyl-(pentapeptide) pyrophosphoryl-undecaprenol N-acetylglucosamine transferase [bacterium]
MNTNVLFVGGGTLGSVTPLLAVAEATQRKFQIPDSRFQILFLGTRRGPERAIVEAAGIPFRAIPAGKLRRYWDLRNLLDVFVIAWAFVVALSLLLRRRPDVVAGAGSFVQVPVMWAAWVLRIPIVIHQLDVRPSLANRLVAPLATSITAVFSGSAHAFGRRTVEIIGNPIRSHILSARTINAREAKRRFGFSGDRPVLLVIGGGTGAQSLNELVWSSLPLLTPHTDVLHVTGRGKSHSKFSAYGGSAVGGQIPDSRFSHNYRSFELLTDDLPYAYAAANLVVARAGMGTITELTAIGKPMALVPMPGTHQEENAAAVAAAGAGLAWDERGLTPEVFAVRTQELLADTKYQQTLARACAAFATPGATDRFVAVLRADAQPH